MNLELWQNVVSKVTWKQCQHHYLPTKASLLWGCLGDLSLTFKHHQLEEWCWLLTQLRQQILQALLSGVIHRWSRQGRRTNTTPNLRTLRLVSAKAWTGKQGNKKSKKSSFKTTDIRQLICSNRNDDWHGIKVIGTDYVWRKLLGYWMHFVLYLFIDIHMYAQISWTPTHTISFSIIASQRAN